MAMPGTRDASCLWRSYLSGVRQSGRRNACHSTPAIGTDEVYVMALYDVPWSITGVSAAALAWLRSTASKDMRLFEMGVFLESGTAAATVVAVGRPAAVSVTPTAIVPQAQDTSAGAAACSASVAATTKPTSPTNFMRRFGMPATLGAGVIWSWSRGLVIPAGPAEFVVWNIGASTSVFGGYFTYEE